MPVPPPQRPLMRSTELGEVRHPTEEDTFPRGKPLDRKRAFLVNLPSSVSLTIPAALLSLAQGKHRSPAATFQPRRPRLPRGSDTRARREPRLLRGRCAQRRLSTSAGAPARRAKRERLAPAATAKSHSAHGQEDYCSEAQQVS